MVPRTHQGDPRVGSATCSAVDQDAGRGSAPRTAHSPAAAPRLAGPARRQRHRLEDDAYRELEVRQYRAVGRTIRRGSEIHAVPGTQAYPRAGQDRLRRVLGTPGRDARPNHGARALPRLLIMITIPRSRGPPPARAA